MYEISITLRMLENAEMHVELQNNQIDSIHFMCFFSLSLSFKWDPIMHLYKNMPLDTVVFIDLILLLKEILISAILIYLKMLKNMT